MNCDWQPNHAWPRLYDALVRLTSLVAAIEVDCAASGAPAALPRQRAASTRPWPHSVAGSTRSWPHNPSELRLQPDQSTRSGKALAKEVAHGHDGDTGLLVKIRQVTVASKDEIYVGEGGLRSVGRCRLLLVIARLGGRAEYLDEEGFLIQRGLPPAVPPDRFHAGRMR